MTKAEKENYLQKKSIGYWCDIMGVVVKDFVYGIDDYAIVVNENLNKVHKLKINYTTNSIPYINLYGRRWSLNDCFRA